MFHVSVMPAETVHGFVLVLKQFACQKVFNDNIAVKVR